MRPRIVLLHATSLAIAPIEAAFRECWPEAETVNLLDGGLSIDWAREADDISDAMIERFVRFGRYGYDQGAAGILATCSAFGPAIERLAASVPVPVLKPNEAMFRAAIARGRHIGMLATFGPSIPPMTAEFDQFAREAASAAILHPILVEGAMESLRVGDGDEHDRLIAARAPALAGCDVLVMAQFSTARAAAAVQAATDLPVLTPTHAAVEHMRAVIS